MNIVPGYGPKSSHIMLIGEMPGREEFYHKPFPRPFVGRSGQDQRWYLSRDNLNPDDFYATNICKQFIEGNPDPSVDQIAYWTPTLLQEIEECQPKLIICVGRFAAQFFLGDNITLEDCHGLPFRAGAIDKSRSNRAPANCIILPCYHPASTYYGDEKHKSLARVLVSYDYQQVAHVLSKINNNEIIEFRQDDFEGQEQYLDVTGEQLAYWIDASFNLDRRELAIDTEGTPDNPWSIQLSWQEGTAYVLRYSQPDFHVGISALQQLADNNCTFIMHCASTPQGTMYDIIMSRVMGLDLSRASIWDTMYALYLLRIESKGLKPAAYRWCGMLQDDYMSIVGGIGKRKQEEYLFSVISNDWPKVEPRIKYSNDGTSKLTTPRHISKLAEGILKDIASGKITKEGETDPYKRWKKVDPVQKRMVEKVLGKMPVATLDDIELEKAIYYAGRDADICLRLKYKLERELERLDLL